MLFTDHIEILYAVFALLLTAYIYQISQSNLSQNVQIVPITNGL